MPRVHKWGKITLYILGIFFLLYLLYLLRSTFTPFLFALIITYILNPPVTYLQKKGIPRILAIALLYLLTFGLLIFAAFIVIPILIRELEAFAVRLPSYTAEIERILLKVQRGYTEAHLPEGIRGILDSHILKIQGFVIRLLGELMGSVLAVFSQLINIILSPIIAFYLLKDWETIKRKALELLPKGIKGKTAFIFREVDGVLSGFIRGQILVGIIVGTFSAIGLFLLNVNFALMLGILAGVTNIIPYFGAVLGATPAVVIAALQSPALALKVIALYIIIQQLESNIITPNIIGQKTGLHQLIIIFALLVGGKLFGIAGMIVAVPVTAILKVLILSLYRLRFEQ